LLPKLQRTLGSAATGSEPEAGKQGKIATAAKPAAVSKGGKDLAANKPKITIPMNKVLVNVSGSMGTRYLLVTMTLVGTSPDFKGKIENNRDQLTDLAAGTLASKTISDLEKPGARNLIRSELTSVFNNALGDGTIQDIYLTEFAIQ
jgi:flagellar FliL protein